MVILASSFRKPKSLLKPTVIYCEKKLLKGSHLSFNSYYYFVLDKFAYPSLVTSFFTPSFLKKTFLIILR